MVQFILSGLVLVPAFLAGMEVTPIGSILITAIAIWIKATFTVGEQVPDGNFRKLSSDEFQVARKHIFAVGVGLTVFALISYGLGCLVGWLF
tara:strand:+ start:1824 stop:2099 length:276 start_codon:yes stop_codon:yes gene_type:complete